MSAEDLLVADNLHYLFHRPTMPLLKSTTDVMFILPRNYWNERYTSADWTVQMENRASFNKPVIEVRDIPIPDISLPMSLSRDVQFIVLNPYHQNCTKRLVEIFKDMPDIHQFLSACVYCRERVNPFLFVCAAFLTMSLRQDTRGIPVPTHVECFPQLYLNGSIFLGIKEVANVPVHLREPREVPYTENEYGGPLLWDPETKLVYWREDVGINLRNWNWYAQNPKMFLSYRRGEYFIYMCEQTLARYNFERLCNGLNRAMGFPKLDDAIREGYVPNLRDLAGNLSWSTRMPNSVLQNVNRPADHVVCRIDRLCTWLIRIFDAIVEGVRMSDGPEVTEVEEFAKLIVLGNMIENNSQNFNQTYYRAFHNSILMMFGFTSDPVGSRGEPCGVICNPATSMRDPLFYRCLENINFIAQTQISKLKVYPRNALRFQTSGGEVRIISVEILNYQYELKNEFRTFWQQSHIDLSKGLDFNSNGPLHARITHLQHESFIYRILIDNPGGKQKAMVRIFLSPKYDEMDRLFSFETQRMAFVEQDKFFVELIHGRNVIERHSKDSTLAMPYEEIFPSGSVDPNDFINKSWIGWPKHLLIPRGTAEGYPCELFVIITSTAYDETTDIGIVIKKNLQISDTRIEDGWPYGFPFDRPAPYANTLLQFRTRNMSVIDTCIRFSSWPIF